MNGPTSLDRSFAPRYLLIALAQWPLALTLTAISERGSAKIHALVIVAVLAAIGLLLRRPRGRFVTSPIVLAVVLIVGAQFLSLRWEPITVFLTLAAVTLLFGAFASFGAGRRRAALVAFCCFALFLGLDGAELLLGRVRGGGFSETHEGRTVRPDDRLTCRLIPDSTGRQSLTVDGADAPEFDVEYHIDSNGRRRVPGQPADAPAWCIFGGSYTYGVGANDDETIPARIQEQVADRRVENYAVSGFGAADVYLQMKEDLPEAKDARLCAYFMIDDHVRRAACPDSLTRMGWGRDKPRFALRGGKLRYLGPAYDSLSLLRRTNVDLLKRSALWRAAFDDWSPSDADLDLTRALILGMKKECEKEGTGRFALVILPRLSHERDVLPSDNSFQRALRAAEVPILDLRGRFREMLSAEGGEESDWFFSNDHPRPNLNRRIAEWAVPFLRRVAEKR